MTTHVLLAKQLWSGHQLSSLNISVVNGFPVCVFCFVLVEKTKSAKNIWEPVFESIIILGFLMADTSSKEQKMYIFC